MRSTFTFLATDEAEFKTWLVDHVWPKILQEWETSSSSMRLLWLQGDINDAEVASALGLDMVLCGIALVLVFAALIAHMRSPVLAIVAMGQVLVSIPVAQYFYLRVFDVYIIYLLNFLSVFIVAGIGADDAFLFFDTLAQTMVERQHKRDGLRRVTALQDYKGDRKDELSFKTGDVLIVEDEAGDGWWRGRLAVGVGKFPARYVAPCDEPRRVTAIVDRVPDAVPKRASSSSRRAPISWWRTTRTRRRGAGRSRPGRLRPVPGRERRRREALQGQVRLRRRRAGRARLLRRRRHRGLRSIGPGLVGRVPSARQGRLPGDARGRRRRDGGVRRRRAPRARGGVPARGASMATTSVTSAAAFYALAVSELPAIQAFGIFTGTLIMVNFVLVVSVFPAVLVLFPRSLRGPPEAGGASHRGRGERDAGARPAPERRAQPPGPGPRPERAEVPRPASRQVRDELAARRAGKSWKGSGPRVRGDRAQLETRKVPRPRPRGGSRWRQTLQAEVDASKMGCLDRFFGVSLPGVLVSARG